MRTLIFDIETGALDRDTVLDRVGRYPEFIEKPFDPGSVKCGNIKDPAKLMAKVDEARAKHELGRDEWKIAKEEHERAALERAALSPVTGQVVAIGMMEVDESIEEGEWRPCAILGVDWWADDRAPVMNEHAIINGFWSEWTDYDKIIGHNIFSFDLPFLVRRSWMLGIEVPATVMERDRYWNPVFVDTMARWACGSRDYVSLDTLAKVAGHKGKNGDGADFARLWFGTDEERETAKAYLENDLVMTFQVSLMLGLV